MTTAYETHSEESVTTLVSGIVDDFRDLVKHEIHLAREEVTTDLRKTREAGMLWGAGAFFLLLAAVAFVLMLANLLHTLTSPSGSDPASIPLWGCYAIVGVLLGALGAGVAVLGQKKFSSIHIIDKQLNHVAKEVSNG